MHESDELTENPHSLPTISYPDDLPVSARRAEIAQAIKDHQVVIVCGETGSGKTTQLPKICLELGRGLQGKIIGHTQPRRLAATSVAKRIAQELQSEIGDWVGYQIRFNDKTGPRSAIKLMTDGILLAESQRDPLLSRYDTIIIDEAHERSLNIDFLLGFLKQLLPRRPDLKLIITSATIDAERFAQHFAHKGKKAPVIEVSGRLYPVDIVYRPILDPSLVDAEERRSASEEERDLMQGIVDAVQECARHGTGDILVFLPGEREIREATEALEKEKPINTVILPLFARLSQADQERIFRPKGNARRVVLATNVAETSLTVPGIRFVVDSGLARIKRYSWRNKVEQLRIEAISQASASQRAGRCGRIGPGICIRLYDEQDFKSRPPFTDPEILRSSLASVILRMKALHLDDVETFPFVEPPTGRAIADGYQILQELGALDEQQRLTKVGRSLAKLPVDPRVARMILAGHEHHCLTEMLIVASAMSVQDPRDRPVHEREAANQAHARFNDDKSEFLSYVKLWNWLEELSQEQSSQRKFANSVKQALLSPLRIREWRDVHTQLRSLVQEQRWVANPSAATYEQVHLALLTGLIGNIGYKSEETGVYQGTRELRFVIHPGSKLVKKAGRWILAGELMETTRLFARCVARIEPQWIEKVGAHLLRKTWGDPRWEKKAGQVVANERATLYGLLIYSGRRIHFGRIDPVQARELFLRQALVPGEIDSNLPFLRHNRQQIQAVERLEHQSRRPDILVDEELIYAFYDQRIPKDVYQTATLEKWFKGLSKEEAKGLELNRDELMQHDAAGITTEVFPRSVEWQGVKMALDYHFEPGSVRDGVTLSVPLFALNQIDAARCEWLVPGMLKEKVLALLKSLPQRIRRHCVPLPDYAAAFHQRWFEKAADPGMSLLDAISQDMWAHVKQRPQRSDFKPETLATHLFMNFRVIDEHGRMLSGGRNLDQLKAEHGRQAQASFQQMAASDEQVAQVLDHEQLTSWSFGELPELMEIKRKGRSFIGYPALIDKKTHCDLDVFDDPAQAQRQHRLGLRRLFRLALREQVRFLEKNITDLTRISMLYINLGTQEQLRDQIIDVALEQSCMMEPWPKNQAEFEARVQEGRSRLGLVAQEVARLAGQILNEWSAAQKKLAQIKAHPEALKDIQQQLNALMPTLFLESNEYAQLAHMPRYLKAVQTRVDKLRADPARDQRLMQDMSVLLTKYQRAVAALKGATDSGLRDFRWMLEELRVSLFAQELRTPMPVSVKRLEKAWAALQR
ncbi:ATP-dependent RNA helicase HrpA [Alcaligenes faecalis]|uniref:ATP-dependent RNA helicase HrpA n=1 Tax=Alcaligenes faecalis TaxID=511 RepID=UPI000A2D564A|nr:ATP-dependent RNA helicase HrpA [Alcaligenes faecalis]OSZ40006.1 ATP-dependent RNA helicase HrpA [Alcaligenes faecalis]OSZ47617.1 ATP-dependent RNA helicase HrpA [Alcaligenes faecalis]OSZ48371.1 ATP-dependent RNA helicase HrpA [Alcaligenes faecalis]